MFGGIEFHHIVNFCQIYQMLKILRLLFVNFCSRQIFIIFAIRKIKFSENRTFSRILTVSFTKGATQKYNITRFLTFQATCFSRTL